jgi:DNA-binding transcriptional MocR family regulator
VREKIARTEESMQKIELVKKHIINEIEQGNIKKGQRLPGCRDIAEKLLVNKITVNKAYKSLEEEHILYCVPRGGYYLVGLNVNETMKSEIIDFQSVRPDPTLIPYRAFTHAINRTIEEHKKSLFDYETPLGLINLRETLKERFEQDGVYTSSSQIMITQGAQQGIYLALRALFSSPSSNKLLVEAPTYNLVLEMAETLQINCIGIERNENGINLDELEHIFKQEEIKAFYIIPRHHNPTGYSLQENKKKKIVELCFKYKVLLIEDDYLADLGSDKRTLPLHYYDTNELTIYIRSFSKTFMPGIRLGALVIPNILCDSFMKQKHLIDINTSSIPQGALDYFIRSGMYDQHIRKVNACYKRKLIKANAILSHVNISGLSFHVPKQGLFIWVTLPPEVSVSQISEKLTQNNIWVSSSLGYYINSDVAQNLRLCISGVLEDDLTALNKIVEVIEEEIQYKLT